MGINEEIQGKFLVKRPTQLTSTIALIGICLFSTLIIILHFLPTGYNPLRSPTSAYAVGKYGFLMTMAFLSMSVGSFALLMGMYKGISKRPGLGLILFGIWAIGVLIAMIFPIAPEGTAPTRSGNIHETNGPITFLSLTVASILISAGFKRNENWLSLYRPALTLSLIMFLIFISVVVNFATGLKLEGVLQRIYLTCFAIWFIIVALHLRRIS